MRARSNLVLFAATYAGGQPVQAGCLKSRSPLLQRISSSACGPRPAALLRKQTPAASVPSRSHASPFLDRERNVLPAVSGRTISSRKAVPPGRVNFHAAAALFQQPEYLTRPSRSRLIGQPTPHTHPHLMREGEVTPGISRLEYELRRTALMQHIPLGGTVVCVGHQTRFAFGVVFYRFHQSTNVFYLCGFDEPDSALILKRTSGGRGYQMTMYVSPATAESEVWHGPRAGFSGATDFFGADESYDFAQFGSHIAELGRNGGPIYVHIPPAGNGLYPENARQALEALRSSRADLRPLPEVIQKQRLVKSPAEVKVMRQAGEISGKAFIQAMKATRPGISESEVATRLQYECKMRGAQDLAYVPVVAGGQNALYIHYVQNSQILREGDLVLVDGGALLNGYTSDVTRTWPVSGTFTEPQRRLYQAVLHVQKECIKLCTERSRLSLNGIHDASVRMLRKELQKIGVDVTEGDLDNRYYPHHVGHYLGLDLHDTPGITRAIALQEGMVVTIEPALYISETAEAFPPEYRGVGIRIEDNVLVTKDDPVVLSVTAPKEVVDIEWLMKEAAAQ